MEKDSSVINGKIYCITNTITGKQYIGQTRKSVESRWKQHIKVHTKINNYLYFAMRKYGIEAFTITELVSGVENVEELNNLERKFISDYNTFGLGYNLTSGGEGGFIRAPSTIAKISGPNSYMYGKTHTPEVRKVISEKAKGRKQSAEVVEKARTRMIGNKYSSTTFLAQYSRNRADKTVHEFYHPLHGNVTTYQSDLAGRFGLRVSAVANLVNGNYKSTKGWTLSGADNSLARNAVHLFCNSKTNEVLRCTCTEFASSCNLTVGTINRLVSGKIKQTRQGWEFKKENVNEL